MSKSFYPDPEAAAVKIAARARGQISRGRITEKPGIHSTLVYLNGNVRMLKRPSACI